MGSFGSVQAANSSKPAGESTEEDSEIDMTKRTRRRKLIDLYGRFAEDRYWQVRRGVCDHFVEFCTDIHIQEVIQEAYADLSKPRSRTAGSLGDPNREHRRRTVSPDFRDLDFEMSDAEKAQESKDMVERLASIYCRLLKEEPIADTRAAAARSLLRVLDLFGRDPFMTLIYPTVADAALDDKREQPQISLANNLCGLASSFGPISTIDTLLPVVLHLLQSQNSAVAIKVAENLDYVGFEIKQECYLSQVFPALLKLQKHRDWRVRYALAETLPPIIKWVGIDSYKKCLSEVVTQFLTDNVQDIREKAFESFAMLMTISEPHAWEPCVMPNMEWLLKNKLARYRTLGMVQTTKLLLPHASKESVKRFVQDFLCPLCKDTVINVRLVLARELGVLGPALGGYEAMPSLKKTLTTLTGDPDVDVAFFAGQAMLACGDSIETVRKIAIINIDEIIPRVSEESIFEFNEQDIVRPSEASSFYMHIDELEI